MLDGTYIEKSQKANSKSWSGGLRVRVQPKKVPRVDRPGAIQQAGEGAAASGRFDLLQEHVVLKIAVVVNGGRYQVCVRCGIGEGRKLHRGMTTGLHSRSPRQS